MIIVKFIKEGLQNIIMFAISYYPLIMIQDQLEVVAMIEIALYVNSSTYPYLIGYINVVIIEDILSYNNVTKIILN